MFFEFKLLSAIIPTRMTNFSQSRYNIVVAFLS